MLGWIYTSWPWYLGQENPKGIFSLSSVLQVLNIQFQQLNRLNIALFTPSLLFSKVAFFLSPGFFHSPHFDPSLDLMSSAKLRELWIIPIFFIVVTIVSMAIAFLLGLLFRLKRSQRYAGRLGD
jgi:predicted permease